MNIRGDARRRRALDEDFFGITLRTRGQIARFRQLKARPIKSTKWACPAMLNHLGIGQQFNDLATAAGLHHFVFSAQANIQMFDVGVPFNLEAHRAQSSRKHGRGSGPNHFPVDGSKLRHVFHRVVSSLSIPQLRQPSSLRAPRLDTLSSFLLSSNEQVFWHTKGWPN